MDKFSRCFFALMTMAVGCMFAGIIDRARSEAWVAGAVVCVMFAMFTLVAMQLAEQWATPAYHSRWMRTLYKRWHKRAS